MNEAGVPFKQDSSPATLTSIGFRTRLLLFFITREPRVE